MDITWEGTLTVWKFMMLGILTGFSFTVGMWCFGKLTGWAPVNLTVTVKSVDD